MLLNSLSFEVESIQCMLCSVTDVGGYLCPLPCICVTAERVGVQGNGSEHTSANNDSLRRS
jgi:hypothetical protein